MKRTKSLARLIPFALVVFAGCSHFRADAIGAGPAQGDQWISVHDDTVYLCRLGTATGRIDGAPVCVKAAMLDILPPPQYQQPAPLPAANTPAATYPLPGTPR
jgi:hypothetical protein